jgi:hypothetical protein
MIRSLIRIKINDVEDAANSVMIEALEIAKSPSSLNISRDISNRPIDSVTYLSLGSSGVLNVEDGDSQLNQCSENSEYSVESLLPDDIASSSVICVQVEIVPRRIPNGDRIYEVTARTLYIVPGDEIRANAIKGYRYGDL